MPKKCLILILLILVITAQFSFADNVTIKSWQEGLELAGILTKPEGDGPFPAVVLLHGCAGLDETNSRDKAWVSRLVKLGYVALQLDSFEPRDLSNICNNWNLIVGMIGKRAQDAYEAKSYLAKLPFVDPNRIAVMGWSHGGTTILDIITRSVADDSPFNAAVAIYPYCYESLSQLKSPVLILIGEKDDWCPADYCTNFMPTGKTDHEAVLKVYPGAYHDFDFEGLDEIYEGHRLLYDPVAAKDAIIQVKSFFAKHLIQKDKKSGKAVIKPFDLSGTWIVTDEWEGCNKSKTDKWTVEISQSDDMIKLLNIERNNSYSGMINNNIISVCEYEYPSRTGTDATNTVHDYNLSISPNADTLTGQANWTWKNKKGFTCGGTTNLTYKRKLKD